jgi:vancomycin resistance protein YoaR
VAAEALDLVRRYSRSEITLRLPDGSTRKLRPAALGAEIDRVRLADFVQAAVDRNSPLGRSYQLKREGDPGATIAVPIPLRIDTVQGVAALLAIKDEIDRPPSDAAIDLGARKLQPEQVGFRLDVYGTLARIEGALRRGEAQVDVAVERIEPKVVATALGNVRFDQVLGSFETRYTVGGKWEARTYNLRLAASRLDGTVLLPGEVFDFNEKVGPRDEAHGYRVAPVIAQGELVDGIGGGTCQISGTLYGAAFFAGLDIVERYPHSRPSYYIKLGLDATVVYPTINFRFRNPFDFPVVLHETVKRGVVRAEILGPARTRTVSFFRRVDEVTPYEEVERETAELPEGKKVLAQRGIPGFKTTVYRVVRDGAYAWRTRAQNQYPPTNQIVDVGTGPKDLEPRKKDDTHPEYLADEYLAITQGPQIRSSGAGEPEPGGGTMESRVPGATGRPGWMERAGMKVYRSEAEPGDEEASTPPSTPSEETAAKEPKPPKEGKGGKRGKSGSGKGKKDKGG